MAGAAELAASRGRCARSLVVVAGRLDAVDADRERGWGPRRAGRTSCRSCRRTRPSTTSAPPMPSVASPWPARPAGLLGVADDAADAVGGDRRRCRSTGLSAPRRRAAGRSGSSVKEPPTGVWQSMQTWALSSTSSAWQSCVEVAAGEEGEGSRRRRTRSMIRPFSASVIGSWPSLIVEVLGVGSWWSWPTRRTIVAVAVGALAGGGEGSSSPATARVPPSTSQTWKAEHQEEGDGERAGAAPARACTGGRASVWPPSRGKCFSTSSEISVIFFHVSWSAGLDLGDRGVGLLAGRRLWSV